MIKLSLIFSPISYQFFFPNFFSSIQIVFSNTSTSLARKENDDVEQFIYAVWIIVMVLVQLLGLLTRWISIYISIELHDLMVIIITYPIHIDDLKPLKII